MLSIYIFLYPYDPADFSKEYQISMHFALLFRYLQRPGHSLQQAPVWIGNVSLLCNSLTPLEWQP